MAEYLAIPSVNAIPASEEIPPEVSVLAEPVAVALHGFHRLAEKSVKPQKIVIIGSGTIGLCCLLVAKSLGYKDVTVVDLISDKLQRAKNFGGNTLLIEMNSTPDDVAGQIKEKLGVYPDLVVDAVGVKASFDQAFQMVSEKGNLLLIGNLAKSVELPLQDLVSKEISLIGTYGFDLKAFQEGVKILPELQDQLQTFIEGHCTLEETPEVMTALAKGERKALKIVIDFE
jgi:threonine dehydrogenase-like Zn-dependent dehydrogenase